MTDKAGDYSATLFLPQTDFPMRAALPEREPKLLARWEKLDLYRRLREASEGRTRFILHDGPPYANGNVHLGTALNKILKDIVTRTHQMMGFDSNYVPGWDCHGLPIEWKVEEEYRAKNKDKDQVPIVEFRRQCREFAEHWIKVQRAEFMRLGIEGDWDTYYTTMSFAAEAQIARELMKFAMSGQLYRGSKPVMWSVVEKTALAEAEVEYEDYTSDTVWVKFPLFVTPRIGTDAQTNSAQADALHHANVVIWTTTPWTIPGNRAIAFSPRVQYGVYRVTNAPDQNWAKRGDKFVLARSLAADVMKQARVSEFELLLELDTNWLSGWVAKHPLQAMAGYGFLVPLLAGEHVTDEDGTGFVHTAPGHGRDDFDIWTAHDVELTMRNINTAIPFTVDEDGRFTKDAPGFEGKRVLTDKGEKGDANEAVIKALIDANMLIARGRLKHQYPHSWRSKKPVIFRNTRQWFIAMDKPFTLPLPVGERSTPKASGEGAQTSQSVPPHPAASRPTSPQRGEVKETTLRQRALDGIKTVQWVPRTGENRITGMIESRPDWVISRQRAWGVPITVFRNKNPNSDGYDDIVPGADYPWSNELVKRIGDAFEREGADVWFAENAKQHFLGGFVDNLDDWEKVEDILDVWFDSGSTHAFTLEVRPDLKAKRPPAGKDRVLYLEGSDQHRGWFQSSLLESCGTRGRPPFDIVLTHGFILDEKGEEKMSKSRGNIASPQDVAKQYGADILRLWVGASDYADDIRYGPEVLNNFVDAYRKLRNTLRWLLGSLHHFHEKDRVPFEKMPELERVILHRLSELDDVVRRGYAEFDYKRVFAAINSFMNAELSAFYFDVRKDALYCDPISSVTRKACLTVLDELHKCLCTWLAPVLAFTAEEVWLARHPSETGSVHLQTFPEVAARWRDDALAEKWRKIRLVRRVVTGALEVERAQKRIGASLEADPFVYVADSDLFAALVDVDLAEVCITSAATLVEGEGPADAFRLAEVPGVAVVTNRARGTKCARSWKISPAVGSDPQYPDVTPRDAQALREFHAKQHAAE